MTTRNDNPVDRAPEKPGSVVSIWFASLAPPVAALAHLHLSFILEHTACATGSKVAIHVVTIALLATVVWAAATARSEWIRQGSADPGQLPGPVGTRRLLALFGMLGALIFGLFILAQWFPNLILGTCVRT
jgi:hypothetical protein